MIAIITLNIILLFVFKDAQICTMGFPTTVPDCSGGNCITKQGTFIVPDMNFTCSGTVTGWRVAGERLGGDRNSALIIWRERSSEHGTYNSVDTIELAICAGQRVETGMNNVYECTLNQGGRVSVQPGDIIGIDTPGLNNAKFRLYFDSSSGPTNYIFNSQAPQTINLDDSNELDQLVPQISLTVTTSTIQIPMTEMTDGSTTTNGSSPAEVVPTTLNGGSSVGVVVGSLIGVIMLVSLLSTVAILILVVAYQSRKYRRDVREREARINEAQNVNMVDVEIRPNDSYIPIFRQISTEANAAYGYGENLASNGGYLTIVASVEGNDQESVIKQSEENYYERID